ncbi:unnamed protein product [Caenorhabditis auriculariae]|uniref:Galactose-1-phosphate uridylyltransferase n=1 Tax=Caenorhabditis auriculariae TaxID=2777116 RepID=A0A8S1HVF4_9PELO|nr:unnamed protein product [Caenorhabditis auriculariae]
MTEKQNNYRRFNPLLDEWVIVAANRVNRPWQGASENVEDLKLAANGPSNPLAPGGFRSADKVTPNYEETYVFDNDFPSFTDYDDRDDASEHDELFKQEKIRGVCRVICYHPDCLVTLATMQPLEVLKVVKVWREQYVELQPKHTWVQIFENRGAAVGCSNMHPHGQLWAGNFLPTLPERKNKTQKRYFDRHKRPLLLDYLNQEVERAERIVLRNDNWTVLVPFWAFWPFETILLPNRHVLRFTDLTHEEEATLAEILQQLVIRYDNIFRCTFPYSMGWLGAPTGPFLSENCDHWQLHASFHPPLLRSATIPKYMAGYEVFAEKQRDITPEQAARIIRDQQSTRFSQLTRAT